MSRSKRIFISIPGGIVLTILSMGIAKLIGNKIVSYILLPPVGILFNFLGPEPIMGYDANGNPLYEGNIVDIALIYLGLFLCVPFYSLICFFVLSLINRRKRNTLK